MAKIKKQQHTEAIESENNSADANNTATAESMAEQLRMAGRVQRDFLPKQLPNNEKIHWARFFAPAEWVSGDIYDIVRLDEQHVGFYIADAVGHSMPAALLTMFLKQAIVMRQTTVNSYRIFEPSEVVSNLNARMTEQELSDCQFATCCYCLLNTDTLQLSYARAGHPYPILLRPNRQPENLESRGGLLGVFADAQFVQQNVQLEPGDKMFLYSDGAESVVGSVSENGRFDFSDEFCQLTNLPVEEMVEQFGELAINQNNQPEPDDITAIALEIL